MPVDHGHHRIVGQQFTTELPESVPVGEVKFTIEKKALIPIVIRRADLGVIPADGILTLQVVGIAEAKVKVPDWKGPDFPIPRL